MFLRNVGWLSKGLHGVISQKAELLKHEDAIYPNVRFVYFQLFKILPDYTLPAPVKKKTKHISESIVIVK
jgi:hypothetical protein